MTQTDLDATNVLLTNGKTEVAKQGDQLKNTDN
jgi:hypothetical protein